MASLSDLEQQSPLSSSRFNPELQPGTTEQASPGSRRRPRRSSSRLERRETFLWPAQCGDILPEQATKHKTSMSQEKGAGWRRTTHNHLQEEGPRLRNHDDQRVCEDCEALSHSQGSLSDSENEEPVMKRTRNVSAFVRKPKRDQRSHSCTAVEGGAKAGLLSHQPLIDTAGGVLLSSENSRPSTAPGPRRSLMTSQASRERSVSPASSDSISGELTHFKPIESCPRTPPKQLADGRLLLPPLVKATPRNLWRRVSVATTGAPAVVSEAKQGRAGPEAIADCRGIESRVGRRGAPRHRRGAAPSQVSMETGRLHGSRPEPYFLRSWAGHVRRACKN